MAKEDNIIFGIHPILEALEAGTVLDKIYLQAGSKGLNIDKLQQLAKSAGVKINHVPIQKLNKLTQKNHQGVVARTSDIEYHNLNDIINKAKEAKQDPFILILDRITDVRNIGAIARSADAFGVHSIVIPTRGTAQLNSDAIKASAGALNHVPVCREEYIDLTIRELKDNGITIVACTEKTDNPLSSLQVSGPVAVILGSEENGISPKYLKLADHKARINMVGNVSSLNVSVAAGIILNHLANN